MTEDQEEEKRILNKDKPEMNRGVELLLRNRRRKPERPKLNEHSKHPQPPFRSNEYVYGLVHTLYGKISFE